MTQFLYKSFAKSGGDHLLWQLDSRRLRILCYHGICADRLAEETWVPRYFVTQSAFEGHLQYLRHNAKILPLSEAVARLQDGSLPPRAVSITFDDGYANNLNLAYSLLRKYEAPATIFLSSAYIESGELFPFLKVKLIQLSLQAMRIDTAAQQLPEYKSNPIDLVIEQADRLWADWKLSMSDDQRQTLRPLTIDEVKSADFQLIEFGAHSHTHCILKNESLERRQEEIRTSISKVRKWTGRSVRLFSYPNGERGDFSEPDKQALRAEGIQAAVTGIGGANSRRSELLELKRYPVALHHDESRFRAEVTGFRAALLAASRRLAS